MGKTPLIIIPARMASTRLPGKPLLEIAGKTLLQRTYEQATKTGMQCVVTSADGEILEYCASNGICYVVSQPDHPTGTHRCAEVVELFPEVEVVVNWQVDEPLLDPKRVLEILVMVEASGYRSVGTLVSREKFESGNPDYVKARVVGLDYRQVWVRVIDFSRAPLPLGVYHAGVYVYSRRLLKKLGRMGPTMLSTMEGLEQLAWIENSIPVVASVMNRIPHSVNSESDLEILGKLL